MALSHKASSNSLRSLASTSSTQSGTSLQRSSRTERRRTRSRSRTVTSREALPSPSEPLPANPAQPKEIGSVSAPEPAPVIVDQPSAADADEEGSLIAYLSSDEMEAVKTPRLASFDLPPEPLTGQRPSTAARIAALPEIDVSRANARISITTQESYTSQLTSGTSYYPRSSTTGTVESLPTPSSSASSTFEPEIREHRELDTDDVSYRLRLLVNNNYFLPPAHTKPQPSDFAPPAQELQKKSSTPFLDIFRIGKSKSKPTTPTSPHPSFDFPAPVLRTTSDSSTVAGYGTSRQQAPAPVANSPPPNFLDRTPRVVVVREKMEDIVQAAKQAEEELKLREIFEAGSSTRPQPSATDVIDPTDAVDLPPPSSEYPFAVQASALHGLGVDQSVGAALLAERLPPRATTPSPIDRSDDEWRRALLHDAVSLSLHSSANTSISFSSPRSVVSPGPSTKSVNAPRQGASSPASVRSSGSGKRPTPPPIKPVLEQRILNHPVIESRPISPQSLAVQPPPQIQRRRERSQTESLQSPLRAETPFAPHTPLSPAPRPRIQHTQTEPAPERSENAPPTPSDAAHSLRSVRKTMSTPTLNDIHESRMAFVMTPPPAEGSQSFQSFRASSGQSVYSTDDEGVHQTAARPSVTLSTVDDDSVSEYSQQSPTASAFFDALSSNHASRSSLNYQSARASPVPGRGTLSPPPRMSTGTFRSASPIRHTPSPLAVATTPDQSFLSLDSAPSTEILEPEPTTPPLPASTMDTSSDPTSDDVDVHLPPPMVPITESSPPSFFDTIQSQPNAFDDLDSSDDSGDDDNELTPPRPIFGDNSPLMRLGNHSTPHISRTFDSEADPLPSLPLGQLQRRTSDSKKPVGYVPPRPSFFTERKSHSESGHESSDPPLSTFDYYQYERQLRRPQTSSGASIGTSRRLEEGISTAELQKRIKNQRSLRRLDGLVMKHLEAEKDTIRRIANTMRLEQKRR